MPKNLPHLKPEPEEDALERYQRIVQEVRRERGEFCEACGEPAKHVHHIVPVSDTRIHSPLVYEKANLMILCDLCHALMHPLLRNVSEWETARQQRGVELRTG